MPTDKYILKGHTPVLEPDLLKWAHWFETADRRVEYTRRYRVTVSTVFLGLDHSFDRGTPILFETMVFGGRHDGVCMRSRTWQEATLIHKDMCDKCLPTPFKTLGKLLYLSAVMAFLIWFGFQVLRAWE